MALYLKDLNNLINNPRVKEKYLNSNHTELFLEINGDLYELNNLFYKDGHLVIRGDFVRLGEVDKINLG